MKSIKKNKFYW